MKLLGLNDHEGLWSKKEEFWRNKHDGDFLGKSSKILPTFFDKDVFWGKRFKREFLPFST